MSCYAACRHLDSSANIRLSTTLKRKEPLQGVMVRNEGTTEYIWLIYLPKLCWLLVPIWIRVETFTLFLLKLKVLYGALDLVIARSNHIILVFLRFVRYKCSVYLLQEHVYAQHIWRLLSSLLLLKCRVKPLIQERHEARWYNKGNKSWSQLLTSFNYRQCWHQDNTSHPAFSSNCRDIAKIPQALKTSILKSPMNYVQLWSEWN